MKMDANAELLGFLPERLAVAPAKWKPEFKKDVIAGCHERLVRLLVHVL